MKIRVLAVLVSVAVLILQVPILAAQRPADEPQLRVRIAVANVDAMKASLETSGYDVLETNSDDSTIELVVSASELRALESSGFSVVPIEQSRPFQAGPIESHCGRISRRQGPRRERAGGAGHVSESRRRARQDAEDRRRSPGDRGVRGPHRDVYNDAADVRGPAHVRAEDLRQRPRRRGRTGDADRRHPPRSRDQRARHRARGRRQV